MRPWSAFTFNELGSDCKLVLALAFAVTGQILMESAQAEQSSGAGQVLLDSFRCESTNGPITQGI